MSPHREQVSPRRERCAENSSAVCAPAETDLNVFEVLEPRRLCAKPIEIDGSYLASFDGNGTLTLVVETTNPDVEAKTFTFTDTAADGSPVNASINGPFKLHLKGKPADPGELLVSLSLNVSGGFTLNAQGGDLHIVG